MARAHTTGNRLQRIVPKDATLVYRGRETPEQRARLRRVMHELNLRSLIGHGPRVSQESIRHDALAAYLDAVEERLGLPPLPRL